LRVLAGTAKPLQRLSKTRREMEGEVGGDTMARRSFLLIGLAVAAVLAIALVAWLAARPPVVRVAVVQPQDTELVLAVVGRVRPLERVEVLPVNPGQVVRLLRDEGDIVTAGEPLGVIKSVAEEAQTEAEQARVAAARARAAEARQALSRTTQLFERGFASQAALDQARAASRAADAEVNAAAATARAALARTREFTVTAPMAGLVLARPIDPGQVVTATTTLFELGSLTGVEIEAEVDEAYAGRVKPGMTARISPSGAKAVEVATVSEVSPKVDASTGGRLVRLRPAQAGELVPGRSVDVTIVVAPAERRIVVPRQALVEATVDPKVYVAETDGVVRARAVGIADWPSIDAIVESGLSGGERVVLTPAETRPGARVRVQGAGR
jgi:RND family efflux transporter MFP subunit